MPRSPALAVAALGVAVMVAASLYAPAQPELLQDGAACEIAPCGLLEDPERWRTAWWVWSAGLLLLLAAIPFAAVPTRIRPRWAVVGLLAVPMWLVVLAVTAWAVSLWTSVHGAATVAVCGGIAPAAGLLAGWWKAARTRT